METVTVAPERSAALVGLDLREAKTARDAEAMLKRGADVNARATNGRTPLHVVRDAGVAAELLKAGANTNARDENGFAPLHFAASPEIVRLLVKGGADPNVHSLIWTTPLHHACSVGVARALFEAGAWATELNHDGESAAVVAGKRGDADLVAYLLSIGCPLNKWLKEESDGNVRIRVDRFVRGQ